MVAKVKVLKYGSNRLRRKMNHIPHLELSQTKLEDPIKKGKNFKPRKQLYADMEERARRKAAGNRPQSAEKTPKYMGLFEEDKKKSADL